MKNVFKFVKGSVIAVSALFLAYLLFATVVWKNVATGQDRDVTTLIRHDFMAAVETNFQKTQFVVSPSRNKTVIFVSGALSQDEKERLVSISKNVSAKYGNRKITIVYK